MGALRKYIWIGFRFFLFCLFVAYYSSITMFFHAHHIQGRVVVHSHFFRLDKDVNGQESSHAHSSESLVLIQMLDQICWDSSLELPEIPEPVSVEIEQYDQKITSFYRPVSFELSLLRAPPLYSTL